MNHHLSKLILFYYFCNTAYLAIFQPYFYASGMVRGARKQIFHHAARKLAAALIFLQVAYAAFVGVVNCFIGVKIALLYGLNLLVCKHRGMVCHLVPRFTSSTLNR
jgi:fatty acid desaturase